MAPAYGGGGGGAVTFKDDVDAQDDKTRARNDARFAELFAKLDALPKPATLWQMIALAAIAVLGLVTILGIMADRFDGGLAASGLIEQVRAEQAIRDDAQDAKLDAILRAATTD
jgi:anti-sigma factor RsiW